MLIQSDRADEPKQFWKEARHIYRTLQKQNINNKVTKDLWLKHFMTVFNSENNDGESDVERWERNSEQHFPLYTKSLDCPISEEEVTESILTLNYEKQVN